MAVLVQLGRGLPIARLAARRAAAAALLADPDASSPDSNSRKVETAFRPELQKIKP